MNFKDFLSESYVISDNPNVVDVLSKEVRILNCVNNNFKYLHVNSHGLIFNTLHERLDNYYSALADCVDYVLETIASYNTGAVECCPVNFNDTVQTVQTTQTDKSALKSEKTIIDETLKLIKTVLEALEKCRSAVSDNDAVVSKLDEIAAYWQKEHTYLLKRIIQ